LSAHGHDSAGVSNTCEETVNDSTFNLGHSRDTSIHAQILYTVTNPLDNVRWKLGLRTRDIPHTLWQLLPYSFMVDRVVNVSDLISGFTALTDPDVHILSGSITERTEDINTVQIVDRQNPTFTFSFAADIYEEKQFSYGRSPWRPSVFDTVPNIDVRNLVNTATKMTDLAALILQRLR